jgi:hypothetical protein
MLGGMKSIPLVCLIGVVLIQLVQPAKGGEISPGAAAAEAGPAQTVSVRTDLFNGTNFDGWTFYMRSNAAPEKTWSLTNGLIRCTGKPNGYLRTARSYRDYRLTVEWRFLKPGNTGVLVDMQLPDAVWARSVECQGMHERQGDFWLWGGVAGNEPANLKQNGIQMLQPSAENPVGEWNTYQTVCRSNTVEILVNGKAMNRLTGLNVASGYIGLQSEGATLEIRKVYLEPLAE